MNSEELKAIAHNEQTRASVMEELRELNDTELAAVLIVAMKKSNEVREKAAAAGACIHAWTESMVWDLGVIAIQDERDRRVREKADA